MVVRYKHAEMLKYMVNDCPYSTQYLSYTRILPVIKECLGQQWPEGLQIILGGSTFKSLFSSFTTRGRIKVI